MKFTESQAHKIGEYLNINFNVINIKEWTYALNVELEHGKKINSFTNVTNDDILKTAKIAIAHLIEYPDYYRRLKYMEKEADQYWANKKKLNIFN